MDSKDGLHFDSETGIREGIPCEGVIVPSTLEANPGTFYDAIVIGAGYAGLVAARDLAIRGMQSSQDECHGV
jgi:NADPH-dependent 2,4-dienoyl-CoA reductase/sulfur reductase-like enzyme